MNSSDTKLILDLMSSMELSLRKLANKLAPVGKAVTVKIFETLANGQQREAIMDILKVGSKKQMAVSFFDDQNNPAPVDGAPKWSSTDDTLVKLTPADDGMSCLAEFNGLVGSGKIQVHADPDMTPDGTGDIVGEYEFQLVAGEATIVKIVATDVAAASPAPAAP